MRHFREGEYSMPDTFKYDVFISYRWADDSVLAAVSRSAVAERAADASG
jgi:hypothetical protein